MYKDYYQVLGIHQAATPDEIKAAFRRLARTYHPDVNPADPQAAQKIQEIIEAYQLLGDPVRRANYDRQCGYDRVVSQPDSSRFTTSAWSDARTSARPATPRPMANRTAQELERFVIWQIEKEADPNDIIYEVCLTGDMFWSEAAAFVGRIVTKQPPAGHKRFRVLYAAIVAMIVIGGGVAAGLLLTPAGQASQGREVVCEESTCC